MDLFKLKIELIDFSACSPFRWRSRRVLIGCMLTIYYTYAFLFFFMVAFPDKDFLGLNTNPETQVQLQNNPLQTEQNNNDVGRGENRISNSDAEAVHPLLLMVTFGFIGGVFFITRTFVSTSQKPVHDGVERKDLSVSWYLTRPLQSALMAIFIYYAFRAGQLVFYSMEGAPREEQINVFTLSLIAIIAGAFSEQAFEKLHDIAMSILKTKAEDKSE